MALSLQQWREDPAALRAWQMGQTGFPLVDAGEPDPVLGPGVGGARLTAPQERRRLTCCLQAGQS